MVNKELLLWHCYFEREASTFICIYSSAVVLSMG